MSRSEQRWCVAGQEGFHRRHTRDNNTDVEFSDTPYDGVGLVIGRILAVYEAIDLEKASERCDANTI